jgi:hypothetical protein
MFAAGLIHVQIELRDVRFGERSGPRVGDDADNRSPRRTCFGFLDRFPKGSSLGQKVRQMPR